MVIEDDVVFENEFLNKSTEIAPEAQKEGFEFLYLGRKPIYPEKEKRLSSWLTVPEYSYWTCGYVITPEGAEKLYNGGYNEKIIPVDEYIPYMYGSHHESINNLYDSPQNLKAYATVPEIVQPHESAFEDSETEKSEPYKKQQREDVKVFAFATETNDGLKMLYESSLKYGVALDYVGLDKDWSGGNEARLDSPGGGQKVNILKNTIKDMVDDTLVIFTDGYDVLYNDSLNVILAKFQSFDTKVLFGAEVSCWPDENLKTEYPEVDSPLKYLNSGVIIGYVGELKRITNEDISDTDDDQLYYTKKYLSGEFDIKLDHNCEIIQNLSFFDQVQINKLNSKLENTLFNTTPCIIHGNGGIETKMTLYKMSTFLTNFKNHYGYTPVNEIEVNELPKIAYSINLEETEEKIIDTLENLLNINYPQEKIYFHANMGQGTMFSLPHRLLEHVMSFGKFYYTENHKKTNILRENALKEFLDEDIEYLFTIDSDCRIENANILQDLIKNNKNFVSPLLTSKVCRYSNYWNGQRLDFDLRNRISNEFMTKKNLTINDPEYNAIYDRSLKGCFNVLFVDKCFLIKKDILHKIQDFYRKNNENNSDKAVFCANMINEGIHMFLDNKEEYGNIV